jgi:hypothetical protein
MQALGFHFNLGMKVVGGGRKGRNAGEPKTCSYEDGFAIRLAKVVLLF